METRYAVDPTNVRRMSTEELRRSFLLDALFTRERPSLYYLETDRLIVGGVLPVAPTPLTVESRITGTEYFLERRELGIMNIGDSGRVTADGRVFRLGKHDVLYLGTGTEKIVFESDHSDAPARFYFVSAPSHARFPARQMTKAEAESEALGEQELANRRTIYRYIHTGGIKSSQLVMGFTRLEPGSVWNTMPAHTHSRRSEVYLYFDVPAEGIVFHYMGTPEETRHLVVREGQAVASPSWSIHSGTGTRAYSFVWAMAGENQTFADMDSVRLADFR